MWWFANVQSQNHKNLLDIYKLRIETENLNLYEKKQLFGRLIQGKENKVDQDKLAHIYDHLLRLLKLLLRLIRLLLLKWLRLLELLGLLKWLLLALLNLL